MAVDHDIVRLEVPVNDAVVVEVSNGFESAGDDELGRGVVERSVPQKIRAEITSEASLHQEVNVTVVLEGLVEPANKLLIVTL